MHCFTSGKKRQEPKKRTRAKTESTPRKKDVTVPSLCPLIIRGAGRRRSTTFCAVAGIVSKTVCTLRSEQTEDRSLTRLELNHKVVTVEAPVLQTIMLVLLFWMLKYRLTSSLPPCQAPIPGDQFFLSTFFSAECFEVELKYI